MYMEVRDQFGVIWVFFFFIHHVESGEPNSSGMTAFPLDLLSYLDSLKINLIKKKKKDLMGKTWY